MGINMYPEKQKELELIVDNEKELYFFNFDTSLYWELRKGYILPPDAIIKVIALLHGVDLYGLKPDYTPCATPHYTLPTGTGYRAVAFGQDVILQEVENIKWRGSHYLRFITNYENKAHVLRGANFLTGGDSNYYGLSGQIDGSSYEYSSAAGAEVEVHKIDLGQIYSARRIGALIQAYISAANTSNYVKLEYSTDDVTYTEWWNSGALSNTAYEQKFPSALENVDVRYIRCLVNSGTTTETIYVKIFWIPVWV